MKLSQLIQVCYEVDHYMTKKREAHALLKAAGESKCKDLTVLTWDYEAKEAVEKLEIHYKPLWKWLIGS